MAKVAEDRRGQWHRRRQRCRSRSLQVQGPCTLVVVARRSGRGVFLATEGGGLADVRAEGDPRCRGRSQRGNTGAGEAIVAEVFQAAAVSKKLLLSMKTMRTDAYGRALVARVFTLNW